MSEQKINEYKAYDFTGDTPVYSTLEVDAVLKEKDIAIRRLYRALYKACANWADVEAYSVLNDVQTVNRWTKMIGRCIKKAEEYR